MKIFVDSADIDEIQKAFSFGFLDGVTTNPSLIKKAVDKRSDIDMEDYIKQILLAAKGTPVSLEVTGSKFQQMVDQGKTLFKRFNPVAKNVYIKIPVNPSFPNEQGREFEGVQAIKELTKLKIPINATLIFTPEQAWLAAKAGAKFVSPFAGRIDDFIRKSNNIKFEKSDYFPELGWHTDQGLLNDNGIVSGIDLVKKTVEIVQKHRLKTEVLSASLRSPRHVRESALVGANIATVPFKVIQQLLSHFKSQEGMDKFTQDIVPDYADLIDKEGIL